MELNIQYHTTTFFPSDISVCPLQRKDCMTQGHRTTNMTRNLAKNK